MTEAMRTLLAATPLLDFHHPAIEALVTDRGWRTLRLYDRIGAVYDFVRNEVALGFSRDTRKNAPWSSNSSFSATT